jgi:hypothetical protein
MYFKVRYCNCRGGRGLGKCQYRGICSVLIVVINKITCKMMNKIYIGNTKQHFKMRMIDHFQDVKKLMWRKEFTLTPTADTLLASGPEERLHQCQVCSNLIKCEILWKGNPTLVIKTFGKNPPALCGIEKGWKLLNSHVQSPIILSILAPKCMVHATTNQSSI